MTNSCDRSCSVWRASSWPPVLQTWPEQKPHRVFPGRLCSIFDYLAFSLRKMCVYRCAGTHQSASGMAVRPSHGWVKQFAARESAALRGAAADGHGILSGLNFVVKDMYEVASHANACGNPTWLATHSTPAQSTAPCVQALLDAGATLTGMSQMDELAYSLNGALH